MAGFRRKKARVGDAFQVEIPKLLTKSQREQEDNIYDRVIASSEMCHSLNCTSNPSENMKSDKNIDNTSVEHAINQNILESQRSFNGFDFDYPFYVENYRSTINDMIQEYYEYKSTSNRRSTRKKNIVNYAEWLLLYWLCTFFFVFLLFCFFVLFFCFALICVRYSFFIYFV